MGLANNIPMIEARNALTMAQAIGASFGGATQLEALVRTATGNAEIAYRVRMRLEHEKAVRS
jgi:hypothetical protein